MFSKSNLKGRTAIPNDIDDCDKNYKQFKGIRSNVKGYNTHNYVNNEYMCKNSMINNHMHEKRYKCAYNTNHNNAWTQKKQVNNGKQLSNHFKKRHDRFSTLMNQQMDNFQKQNSYSYDAKHGIRLAVPLIRNHFIHINFRSQRNFQLAMLDTGATHSYITNKIIASNPYLASLPKLPLSKFERSAELADGSVVRHTYKIKPFFRIGLTYVQQTMFVFDTLSTPIILGQDFFEHNQVVISFLNNKVYIKHNPNLISAADYKIRPNHVGSIVVKIPGYVKKNELLMLQPSIKSIQVADAIIKAQRSGKYQPARIMIKNTSDKNVYINKNDVIGVMDIVQPECVFQDPIRSAVSLLRTNRDSNNSNSVTNEGRTKVMSQDLRVSDKGRIGKNKCHILKTPTASNTQERKRTLNFFEDRSIDISKFEELTKEYDFKLPSVSDKVDSETIDKLKWVLLSNLQAFHLPGSPISKIKNFEVQLEVKEGSRPWGKRFYPIHPTKKQQANEQAEKLIKQGILKPIEDCPAEVINSQFVSPCMLIKKPNSSEIRLVTDLRELNKILLPYPPSESLSVEQSVIQIAAMPLDAISQLDVSMAYFQIGLNPKSWKFSVVSIGSQKLALTRLPMGLSSSAAIFSDFMTHLLGNLYFNSVISYLDDVYLASKSSEEHLKLLNDVFTRSIKAGLQFKAAKCLFFQDKITYLGQTIKASDRSIRPKELKVKALLNLNLPRDIRQLRRFLGMLNFFKAYIPQLSTIASPLYKLLRGASKNEKIHLKQVHIDAINKLKSIMASDRVLYLPDYSLPFELVTDASTVGLSAILFQRVETEDKKELRIISYGSRTLNPAQSRYDIYILEALAILSALLTFQQIIQNQLTNIYSDNIALKYLLQTPQSFNKPSQSRLKKWLVLFEMFQFRVYFLKGRNNVADALSRDLTEQGNSLIDESRINDFINNKLDTLHTKSIQENLDILKQKGYKFKNQLTPQHVNTSLSKTGEKCNIERIYETSASLTLPDKYIQYPLPQQQLIGSQIFKQQHNNESHLLTQSGLDNIDIPELTQSKPTKNNTHKKKYEQLIAPNKNTIEAQIHTKNKSKGVDNPNEQPRQPHTGVLNDSKALKSPNKDADSTNQLNCIEKQDFHIFALTNQEGTTYTNEQQQLLDSCEIAKAQRSDIFCAQIFDLLEKDIVPDDRRKARLLVTLAQDCCIQNGVLYRVKIAGSKKLEKPRGYQLIVPKSLQQQILEKSHADTAHAALSTFVTYLRDHFYWPKLMKSAVNYINSCSNCQKFGSGFIKYQTSYIFNRRVFLHIETDVIGPFHKARSGAKYALTIIDVFSGYLICEPLITTTAKEICECLIKNYLIFSFPLKISTDNAQYFNSKFFQALHDLIGTFRPKAPSHASFIFGQVERSHAQITNRLAKCIQDDKENWDLQLKYATFSHNVTKSKRTSLSPQEIVFGQKINCPSISLFSELDKDITVDEHMKYIRTSLHHNIVQARMASQEAILKMIKYTNEHAQSTKEYIPGEIVWVYKPDTSGLPKKLSPRYKGPFFIVSRVHQNQYKVSRSLGGPHCKSWVASQRLKPYYLQNIPPPDPDSDLLRKINQSAVPDLSTEAEVLKDSCVDDDNVRSTETSIDIYEPIVDQTTRPKDEDRKTQSTQLATSDSDNSVHGNVNGNVSETPSGDETTETDSDDDSVDSVSDLEDEVDMTKIIDFQQNASDRPKRNKNASFPNTQADELTKRDILKIFGVILNKKKTTYLVQLKNAKIVEVTRDHLDSVLIAYLHGKHLQKLSQKQVDQIIDKYEI